MSESADVFGLTPQPLLADPEHIRTALAQHAPYLSRLLARDGEDLDLSAPKSWSGALQSAFERLDQLIEAPERLDVTSAALRQIKRRVHLLLALQDLTREARLDSITRNLTHLAERSLQAALVAAAAARDLSIEGLFFVAFGKMGAYELNYSSDIDVAAFFDPDRFEGGAKGPQDSAIRLVRDVVQLMEAQTAEGYVFRTDLRLRPDPSSTPIAVSTRRATVYYESVGQNWERMAWIKARPCAGDSEAALAWMQTLEPFVWRRHLDYWALADIHAVKAMINAKVGDLSDSEADCDVKLGPGGIREIEFFVQTQQIILGGRDPALRKASTLDALQALAAAGQVAAPVADTLARAYRNLRALEHRIQMLNDEQTHTLPANPTVRTSVATLMGVPDVDAFNAALHRVRTSINHTYEGLFANEPVVLGAAQDNLVFTGVDDDPGTVAHLQGLGFSNPSTLISTVREWHRGNVPATRSPRGQALLTAIMPRLLQAMSESGEADRAFTNFGRFFEGLSAGVQVLSLLNAEPDVLDDLVATLAVAPRLAEILARRPALLESLLVPVDMRLPATALSGGFEAAMNAARRYHRDRRFLIGHQLLNGRLDAIEAGERWSELALQMTTAMASASAVECESRFGAAPGRWAVMGLGSFGARELTADSDLDLIVIYDPHEGASSAQTWFARFTQRLITALTAPTGEGLLYEVDMRLRPSGRAGPVAVQLSAFRQYHLTESWTWEHMALTRMAPICGDVDLSESVLEAAAHAIHARRDVARIRHDIADMRARLAKEKPGFGVWDMKQDAGGLVDIDFFLQTGLLTAGLRMPIQPDTLTAIKMLEASDWLDGPVALRLEEAWRDFTAVRQVLRLAMGDVIETHTMPAGLQARLSRALGVADIDALAGRILAQKAAVRAIVQKNAPKRDGM